jgi:hypothetical protein
MMGTKSIGPLWNVVHHGIVRRRPPFAVQLLGLYYEKSFAIHVI